MRKNGSVSSPSTSGPYSVSRFDAVLIDQDRLETHATDYELRSLSLNIFFPSKRRNVKKVYPYDGGALTYWRQASYWTEEQKKIVEDSLEKFACYTALDKKIPETIPFKGRPLILFSHGFMAFSTLYSFLIEDLVSHGFTVIGINHTYAASYANLGKKMVYGQMTHADLFETPYAEMEQETWIQDCLFVMENAQKIFSAPDLSFFMIGHSFGGSTALHMAKRAKSIIGSINLDGALFGDSPLTHIETPCLILKAEKSVQEMGAESVVADLSKNLGISEVDAERFHCAYTRRLDNLIQTSARTELKELKDINHMAFTDFNFLNQSSLFQGAYVGGKKAKEIITEIREEVFSFISFVSH